MLERHTCQKSIILNYLKNIKTHPTAEQIHQAVKKQLPHISLGTVYRNLNLLRKKGEIQEIFSFSSHFDGDISPHAHFICEKCHKIYDIFDNCSILKKKQTKVGKINKYQIYLYGICKQCDRNCKLS